MRQQDGKKRHSMAALTKLQYFTNSIAVFQGGGCKAFAYIGAYKEALRQGMFFSELAGTSAGSIIAALIAAGATPEYLEKLALGEDFLQMKRPCHKANLVTRVWIKMGKLRKWSETKDFAQRSLEEDYGFYRSEAIEQFMDRQLRRLTGLKRTVCFGDLRPQLHVVSADVKGHTLKIWDKEHTRDESVAKAVRASCSIPFYFTPTDKRYVDGGILSNCPDFLFNKNPDYYQKLTFKLKADSRAEQEFADFKDYGQEVVSTIIDGADDIQHLLTTRNNIIEIPTGDIKATDFERVMKGENRPEILKLMASGEKAMADFLKKDTPETAGDASQSRTDFSIPEVDISSLELAYSTIAFWSYEVYTEVYVCADNTFWSWTIFPTLARWIHNGSKVVVYTKHKVEARFKEQEEARERMLKAMGCLVKDNETDLNGFFFTNGEHCRGLVYETDESGKFKRAKTYHDDIDNYLMRNWVEQLNSKEEMDQRDAPKIELKSVAEEEIISRLQQVDQYRKATINYEDIRLQELRFLNPIIRSLKYKQISMMFSFYEERQLTPFSPAALVFDNGKESLIGPPVIEVHDGRYCVIEGNTRCLYAYRHNLQSLKAIVVRGVGKPFPCDNPEGYPVSSILISERKIEGTARYGDKFDREEFRRIEQCLRPDDQYMK